MERDQERATLAGWMFLLIFALEVGAALYGLSTEGNVTARRLLLGGASLMAYQGMQLGVLRRQLVWVVEHLGEGGDIDTRFENAAGGG